MGGIIAGEYGTGGNGDGARMTSYDIVQQSCGFDPYDFLFGLDYEIVSDGQNSKRYARESPSFTFGYPCLAIEKTPAYVANGVITHRLTDTFQYWQYQICNMLRRDVENLEHIKIYIPDLEDGYFYTKCFPNIAWKLFQERIDLKIQGTIWIVIK